MWSGTKVCIARSIVRENLDFRQSQGDLEERFCDDLDSMLQSNRQFFLVSSISRRWLIMKSVTMLFPIESLSRKRVSNHYIFCQFLKNGSALNRTDLTSK